MEPIIARDRWGHEHDVPHGTRTAYNRHGCRCDDCRLAQVVYMREYRGNEERKIAQHGTRSKYVSGCRCDECRRANTEYSKVWQRLRRMGISMRADWEID